MEGLNFVGAGLIVIQAALAVVGGGSAMDAIARQQKLQEEFKQLMLQLH
jgi:F0F1-type ATP synthase membrane subunit c/vacuolar-type H+-ATPase subunit K